MELKKLVEDLLKEEIGIIIKEDEWIALEDEEFALDIEQVIIHISDKDQSIGLSFNVYCEREYVYHITKLF